MQKQYRDPCEYEECVNNAIIKAAVNRPSLGLALALPNIFKDCREECPYYPTNFVSWRESMLIAKLGLNMVSD